MPYVYRMLSGTSVYLPPETLVNSNGMAYPKDRPDLDTTLRGAFALGNTPMIFNSILPKAVDDLKPEVREGLALRQRIQIVHPAITSHL